MNRNRTLLSWTEPKSEIKHIRSRLSWKDWLKLFGKVVGKYSLGGFILAVILTLLVYLRFGDLREGTFLTFLIFVGGGMILGIVASLQTVSKVYDYSTVSIREKDIFVASTADDPIRIPYKEIQNCSIRKGNLEETELLFLEIKLWDNSIIPVEIAPTINTDDIIQVLKSKSVQVTPSLFNPI